MHGKSFLLPLVALFALCTVSVSCILHSFTYPLPPARISPLASSALTDMSAVLGGVRRLGADIAWIQLLQYYGTPEKPLDKDTEFKVSWDMTRYLFGMGVEKEICYKGGCSEKEHYHPQIDGGVYADFLAYCYRITNLDPFFDHVYLYGAGALAWNLNRPEQALELLGNGIAAMEKFQANSTRDIHQPFWQLNLYASAIIYRKSGEFEKMMPLLELAVRQNDCPNMMRSILANIYQKEGRYADSLKLWIAIYDSGDPSYQARAGQKINELAPMVNTPA